MWILLLIKYRVSYLKWTNWAKPDLSIWSERTFGGRWGHGEDSQKEGRKPMLGIHRAEAAEWIELAKHAGGSVETCVGLQERVQKIDFLYGLGSRPSYCKREEKKLFRAFERELWFITKSYMQFFLSFCPWARQLSCTSVCKSVSTWLSGFLALDLYSLPCKQTTGLFSKVLPFISVALWLCGQEPNTCQILGFKGWAV